MRTAILFFAACLFLNGNIDARNETEVKTHAIQLAAYESWDQMIEHRNDFIRELYQIDFAPSRYTEESVFVEQTVGWLKVYLIHDGYKSAVLLNSIQANPYFEKAFKPSSLVTKNLFKYPSAYRSLSHQPVEYTTKGGSFGETEKASSYKIQLGVFKEEKSTDQIADKFGVEKETFEDQLSYDFVSVNKKVCRRYYYGNYKSKSKALAAKKVLEKESGKNLLVVTE